ncbi:MAG TPA: hypothetical protein VF909_10785 [Roseiflexaceae bacterium]
MPAAFAALDGDPPAASVRDTTAPERPGIQTCWMQPAVHTIIQRVPDPMTRLQLWQRVRQWLPRDPCCTTRPPGLHLPHYTGRVTVPGGCGAGR